MILVKGISLRILLVLFYVFSVLFHKRVNEFIDIFYKKFSFYNTNRFFIYSLILPFIAFVLFLVLYNIRSFKRSLSYLAIVLIPVAVYYPLLFVSNVEFIHYIQYAFISFLLLRISGNIWYSFSTSIVLGIIDETYQYFVLYAGMPSVYLDYNDMLLNIHGSVTGIIIFLILFSSESYQKGNIVKGSEIT